jgi:hypothetical protein
VFVFFDGGLDPEFVIFVRFCVLKEHAEERLLFLFFLDILFECVANRVDLFIEFKYLFLETLGIDELIFLSNRVELFFESRKILFNIIDLLSIESLVFGDKMFAFLDATF